MRDHFTPGEHFEAEEKMRQHEKGRGEANFYRAFLDNFANSVIRELVRKEGVDLDATDLKLKDFEFCSASHIKDYAGDAAKAANTQAETPVTSMNIDYKAIAEMTPSEFVQHIESLKASLIK